MPNNEEKWEVEVTVHMTIYVTADPDEDQGFVEEMALDEFAANWPDIASVDFDTSPPVAVAQP